MPGRQRPYLDEASTWGKGTGTHGSRAHSSCQSHGWKTGHETPGSSTSLGTPCLLADSLVHVQLSGLAGLSEGWENGRLVQDSAGRRCCTQGERRSVCRERWAGPRQLTRDAGVLQDQPQGTRPPSCLGPEDRGAGRRRPWNWRGLKPAVKGQTGKVTATVQTAGQAEEAEEEIPKCFVLPPDLKSEDKALKRRVEKIRAPRAQRRAEADGDWMWWKITNSGGYERPFLGHDKHLTPDSCHFTPGKVVGGYDANVKIAIVLNFGRQCDFVTKCGFRSQNTLQSRLPCFPTSWAGGDMLIYFLEPHFWSSRHGSVVNKSD